jgi:tetratricopeptide (TPR) repeat protein
MKYAEVYNRAINYPSLLTLAVSLGVAALLVIAGLLISFGRHRWLARGVCTLGLVLIMLVLLAIRQQTVTAKRSEIITETRLRYSERARLYASAGLIGVPAVTGIVILSVFMATRRKLRAQVPRHLKAGRKHLIQNDYEAALVEYNQAVHFAPHLAEAYYRRGCVHRAMGNLSLALADFDNAIERDPRLAAALLDRGKARTETGDLDAALGDFQKLLIMRGNDPEFYLNRGICLMKKGISSEAAADFERVLKLTNHSDFADPAKKYLHQYEAQAKLPPPTANANATAPPTYSSKPTTQDYIL